jgi:hypothetical protein
MNSPACYTTGRETRWRAEVVLAAISRDWLPPESPKYAFGPARSRPNGMTTVKRGRDWRRRFSEEWQGKRMRDKEKIGPGRLAPQAVRKHSPALARLSLVGLLLSRARLRFTRQSNYSIHRSRSGEAFLPLVPTRKELDDARRRAACLAWGGTRARISF